MMITKIQEQDMKSMDIENMEIIIPISVLATQKKMVMEERAIKVKRVMVDCMEKEDIMIPFKEEMDMEAIVIMLEVYLVDILEEGMTVLEEQAMGSLVVEAMIALVVMQEEAMVVMEEVDMVAMEEVDMVVMEEEGMGDIEAMVVDMDIKGHNNYLK